MADRHRITKFFNNEPCNGSMEQMVLGFADGTIQDEERSARVMRHLIQCRRCMELFLQYDIIEEALNETAFEAKQAQTPGIAEIVVEIIKGTLRPLSNLYLSPATPVPVLSGSNTEALDFDVASKNGNMPIRIIAFDNHVQIEILTDQEDSSFYLIGTNEYRVQFPSRGVVAFDHVLPGVYLISRDHRSFLKIRIEKNPVN